MHIQSELFNGRQAWRLSNGKVDLVVLAGGGHIAGIFLKDGPKVNPYWEPKWQTIEPWQYKAKMSQQYGAPLLASLSGHSLCLGSFGDPSPEEARAGGPGCHGEAPVARWRVARQKITKSSLNFSYGCELPIARMMLQRTLSLRTSSPVITVREEITNLARCDTPFTTCQHVSFGAPFVEAGTTVFDLAGAKAQTFPGTFGQPQRLRANTAFKWPVGPGLKKDLDLRVMGNGCSRDFYTVLMHQKRSQVWFSVMHPKQGLLVAYAWDPADYPWTGVWEESHARKTAPWNGEELVRGMEFANAPFPASLRDSVNLGKFQGVPTYRWLPARTRLVYEYFILAQTVEPEASAVQDLQLSATEAVIKLK